MRILLQSGPWLLALGVVLTGCSPSGNPPSNMAKPSAQKAAQATNLEVFPGGSEVVLTVQGMS